ncbi:hypothetical protein [Streptomyces sp. NPDC059071]|uniref:hypothetical protein n=1 Tax=unclassified Streptomyces TaxID=2593676 RepID=UPI003656FEC8
METVFADDATSSNPAPAGSSRNGDAAVHAVGCAQELTPLLRGFDQVGRRGERIRVTANVAMKACSEEDSWSVAE